MQQSLPCLVVHGRTAHHYSFFPPPHVSGSCGQQFPETSWTVCALPCCSSRRCQGGWSTPQEPVPVTLWLLPAVCKRPHLLPPCDQMACSKHHTVPPLPVCSLNPAYKLLTCSSPTQDRAWFDPSVASSQSGQLQLCPSQVWVSWRVCGPSHKIEQLWMMTDSPVPWMPKKQIATLEFILCPTVVSNRKVLLEKLKLARTQSGRIVLLLVLRMM